MRLGVLAAVLLLVITIPQPATAQLPACAQGTMKPTLTLGDISSPSAITPISGTQTFSVPYVYTISSPGIYSIEAVLITISVGGVPSWATVTPQSQQVPVTFDQPGSASGTSNSVSFEVAVSANAPAFLRSPVTITATATEGTCVEAAESGDKTVNIQPGFYELWQARFGQAIHKYGQNTNFQIPLIIENSGNGRIEVELSHVRDENGDGRGLDVVVPGGRHNVGSEAQGQAERSTTLNVDVQTPFKNGYMNERIPLAIEITGRSADQQTIVLSPATLRATITTQGVYVPGFELVFGLVAMLGVAMIQMRRRA